MNNHFIAKQPGHIFLALQKQFAPQAQALQTGVEVQGNLKGAVVQPVEAV